MCKHGTTTSMEIFIPAEYTEKNEAYYKPVGIDSCIAPIVKALNDGGVHTVASCCGHEKPLGNIALQDGRELFIVRDFKAARTLETILEILESLVLEEDRNDL